MHLLHFVHDHPAESDLFSQSTHSQALNMG
jgi:hypothetical protein